MIKARRSPGTPKRCEGGLANAGSVVAHHWLRNFSFHRFSFCP